jgi:hypothetical protein
MHILHYSARHFSYVFLFGKYPFHYLINPYTDQRLDSHHTIPNSEVCLPYTCQHIF